MEPANFFAASRLVIVAGKGGVGKTAVTAALARAAAGHGVRTLVVEATGTAAAHRHFATEPLGYAPRVLVPATPAIGAGTDPEVGGAAVLGRAITPDEALVDYLERHGMRRVARRLARSGTLEVIATATPGIKDLLVLGKLKQLATRPDVDLILVDAPASGHALGFLRAAPVLAETARSGPIQHQAAQVLSLLRDPSLCQVLLVAVAEETPVNELIETAFSLEDEVGVHLGPVVINGVYPEVPGLEHAVADAGSAAAAAAGFRLARQAVQRHHQDRLRRELPLEQLTLPFLFPTVPTATALPDGTSPTDSPSPTDSTAQVRDSIALSEHLVAAIRALPDHATQHPHRLPADG